MFSVIVIILSGPNKHYDHLKWSPYIYSSEVVPIYLFILSGPHIYDYLEWSP